MIKKTKFKLGEDGFEAEFINTVATAIMEVVDKKIEQVETRLHLVLEKKLDDFRVYGDMISGTNDIVKRLSDKVDNIEHRMGRMENKMDRVEDRLDNIESDVSDLKGDVGQIKTYIFDNVEPRMRVLEIRDKVT